MKRTTVTCTLLAVSMIGLTACGGSKPEASPQGGPNDAAKPNSAEIANRHVELNVFSNSGDTDEGFNDKFGDAIRKKFPNYTIHYIKRPQNGNVEELLSAGTKIDLIWDTIGYFPDTVMRYNLQYDLTDAVKTHQIDLNRFEPTLVEGIKNMSASGLYGLPVQTQNLVLFYNKDIFDKFGVPYPKDGMTWDEAIALGKKVTRSDGGVDFLGLAASVQHVARMSQFSLPVLDPQTQKPTYNDEKWKLLFQKLYVDPAQQEQYKNWYLAHKANENPFQNEFVKDRSLAMFAFLSSFYTSRDLESMNWDMVTLPTFQEQPGVGSQHYPVYFSIASISQHKEEALVVIKYLISDEYQTAASKQGFMTVLKNDKIRDLTDRTGVEGER
ncbi:ABC transporter substrate-binding protein [Paenibacillus ginsengarvi]|uniref:Carbohydrate ABC transporter substrate-binding protein n=1 Tax=Paenibacillus ginsengarvi TaxID=400777 RepID=A0A3B0BSE9_9BACL|nr:ABC transporter substrate-binding protein [Paenibacillus ginsengarvi]RKN75822.1 carbohydrate ABC transporter substrate-binding protein [Paenibacillus ginsengarvi]